MQTSRLNACVRAGLMVFLAASLVGCPGTGTTTNGTSDDTTLTATEEQAIASATGAAGSLATATSVGQSASGAESGDQSGLDLPTGLPTGVLDLDFGTCPHVVLAASSDSVVNFDLSIDFGPGCQPLFAPDYTYAGLAQGTFKQAEKKIDLAFESLAVGADTLTGTLAATYGLTTTTLSLDGNWDLTDVSTVYGKLVTNGAGVAAYDLQQYITTIDSFAGSLTDPDFDFDVTMDNLALSFAKYERFLPYAGEMTISGQDIRAITVRFSERSPTEGIVEVQIGNGPAFEYNLYETGETP